ncbi:MAG TPA: hypothetical protein VGK40_08220, partial [Verrucomicrobiae bacterium]|jgi:hypothetical protein
VLTEAKSLPAGIALALALAGCSKNSPVAEAPPPSVQPPAWISYSNAPSVSITLGQTNLGQGIEQGFWHRDGVAVATVIGGQSCVRLDLEGKFEDYITFVIHPTFRWAELMNATVEVEYFDAMKGSFAMEYDGNDSTAPARGGYTRVKRRERHTGTQQWRTAVFDLPEARFTGRQGGGADFRLRIWTPEFYVRSVTMRRAEAVPGALAK